MPIANPPRPPLSSSAAARWIACAALAALAAAAQPAHAQPPLSVYLEELTWTELRDQLKGGATTVIVPIGGTEQNGPAMVLGKHNVRARVLAGRIATGLGHAVVAPVIAYVPEGAINPPTAHMRFPGTITIPDAAFESTLEYSARSFRQHGFRDIVLLGDHGGYQKNMVRVADKLNREWAATPVRVHAVTEYYRVVDADYPAALKRQGFRDAEIGTHAGLADTALSLAVDPRIVRADRLRAGKLNAEQGVYGEPSRSTAEAGQLGVDLIVSHTVAAIRQALAKR
jgi:creatinine amidohydrolase